MLLIHLLFDIVSLSLRNIHKDKQELELVTQSDEDMESWKASLLRAGVYPVQSQVDNDSPVSLIHSIHFLNGHLTS